MSEFTYNTYLVLLRREIERKIGFTLHSPSDFNKLIDDIAVVTGELISLSTIKRLWGYVPTEYTPRYVTLSVLARYIGFNDWDDFINEANRSMLPDSAFVNCRMIRSAELFEGDKISFEWKPDRKCALQCISNRRFRVLESENAKIHRGAIFHAAFFAEGHPLYAQDIEMDGDTYPLYICGSHSGIFNIIITRCDEPQ